MGDVTLIPLVDEGERAMGAASLLARAGHQHVTVLEGGPQDWADTTGTPLETGR